MNFALTEFLILELSKIFSRVQKKFIKDFVFESPKGYVFL